MALYKINTPSIRAEELYKQLESIENQLKLNKKSPAAREKLFCDLENTHQSIQALEAKTQNIGRIAATAFSKTSNDLDTLKEKMISLFGDIYSLSINDEIEEIQHETEDLTDSLNNGDLNEICKNVNILSKHIHFFCEQHRPSRENRQIIALARQSLKQANQLLFTKVLGPTINQFNLLALHKTSEEIHPIEEIEPETMTLFEIADLFYQYKFKNALIHYHQLSESSKTKVLYHLKKTGAASLDLQVDIYKTIQALIATAHEISNSEDGEGYLDKNEIDKMFQELNKLKSE